MSDLDTHSGVKNPLFAGSLSSDAKFELVDTSSLLMLSNVSLEVGLPVTFQGKHWPCNFFELRPKIKALFSLNFLVLCKYDNQANTLWSVLIKIGYLTPMYRCWIAV